MIFPFQLNTDSVNTDDGTVSSLSQPSSMQQDSHQKITTDKIQIKQARCSFYS